MRHRNPRSFTIWKGRLFSVTQRTNSALRTTYQTPVDRLKPGDAGVRTVLRTWYAGDGYTVLVSHLAAEKRR